MSPRYVGIDLHRWRYPCPCGTGIKVKRCCRAEPELQVTTPRAVLARLQLAKLEAVRVVGPLGRERFGELHNEVVYLPGFDLSLQVRLPGVLTPAIERAIEACSAPDNERGIRHSSSRRCPRARHRRAPPRAR